MNTKEKLELANAWLDLRMHCFRHEAICVCLTLNAHDDRCTCGLTNARRNMDSVIKRFTDTKKRNKIFTVSVS